MNNELNRKSMRTSKSFSFLLIASFAFALVSCGGSKELVYNGNTSEVKPDQLHEAMTSTLESGTSYEFRGKGTFIQEDSKVDFGYTIRVIRDSAIWIDVADPFLGLKVARAIVYPDSVAMYNRLKSTYAAGGMDVAQERLKLELTFYHLQAILLGEPVYIPESDNDLTLEPDSGVIQVTALGRVDDPLFKFYAPKYHYIYGYVPSLPLLMQKFEDGPRVVEFNYNYKAEEQGVPNTVLLSLVWDALISAQLKHSEVSRDLDLHIPFSIPDGYERVE